MKLSMWMIVNRLQVLEPELSLHDGEKAEIKGVRFYAAENYALVYADGTDVVCKYKDEYFRLHDMEREIAFGLILDVFDYYENWLEKAQQLAGRMRFQELIDSCYPMFGNPVLFLDANYKVMAMSRQYGPEDVDAEWKYLCQNGFSSVQAVHALQERKRKVLVSSPSASASVNHQRLDETGCMNYSYNLLNDSEMCGSLVLMEKSRPVNEGDYVILKMMAELLIPYITKMNFTNQYVWGNSVFSRLLSGENVEDDILAMQLQYYEWEKDDLYKVFILEYRNEEGEMMYRLLRSSLVQNVPFCVAEIHEKEIVFLLNCTKQNEKEVGRRIEDILHRNQVNSYCSQHLTGIERISVLYHQAGEARERAVRTENRFFYMFSEIAADYILKAADAESKYCAVYEPIRELWESGDEKDRELLETLRRYLRCNQSPAETSRQLFVAKNTLNYRIRRLEERLGLVLNDPDQCFYYLLSLEVLRVLGAENE
nr:PucR family transcriptional regulator [uncultured Blautia sp.]